MKKQRAAPRAKAEPREPAPLLYKVVELSNVDEHSLERTLNELVPQGWHFDGVQFAMRESSKRPSMAFVFFTRPGQSAAHVAGRSQEDAHRHLRRIADDGQQRPTAPAPSAYERLVQLAEGGDE